MSSHLPRKRSQSLMLLLANPSPEDLAMSHEDEAVAVPPESVVIMVCFWVHVFSLRLSDNLLRCSCYRRLPERNGVEPLPQRNFPPRVPPHTVSWLSGRPSHRQIDAQGASKNIWPSAKSAIRILIDVVWDQPGIYQTCFPTNPVDIASFLVHLTSDLSFLLRVVTG